MKIQLSNELRLLRTRARSIRSEHSRARATSRQIRSSYKCITNNRRVLLERVVRPFGCAPRNISATFDYTRIRPPFHPGVSTEYRGHPEIFRERHRQTEGERQETRRGGTGRTRSAEDKRALAQLRCHLRQPLTVRSRLSLGFQSVQTGPALSQPRAFRQASTTRARARAVVCVSRQPLPWGGGSGSNSGLRESARFTVPLFPLSHSTIYPAVVYYATTAKCYSNPASTPLTRNYC